MLLKFFKISARSGRYRKEGFLAQAFSTSSPAVTLSVPGKTFLCGEYLALIGGLSLTLATGPRFQLRVQRTEPGKNNRSVFHPESPAGRFIRRHPDFFSVYDLNFEQPYHQGGFGASTAEFLMTRALYQFGQGIETDHQMDFDVRAAWSDYRDLYLSEEDPRPSGADLVGQACGWVTAFERRSGRIQVFSWSFPNLGFLLFATGTKLPTHEHLSHSVELRRPDFLEKIEVLSGPCQRVGEAFSSMDEDSFLDGLCEVGRILTDLGLQTSSTQARTDFLRMIPGVKAAKGCGAMGADVLVVVFDRREIRAEDLVKKAESQGLVFQASEADLQPGLERHVSGGSELQKELS